MRPSLLVRTARRRKKFPGCIGLFGLLPRHVTSKKVEWIRLALLLEGDRMLWSAAMVDVGRGDARNGNRRCCLRVLQSLWTAAPRSGKRGPLRSCAFKIRERLNLSCLHVVCRSSRPFHFEPNFLGRDISARLDNWISPARSRGRNFSAFAGGVPKRTGDASLQLSYLE